MNYYTSFLEPHGTSEAYRWPHPLYKGYYLVNLPYTLEPGAAHL